MKRVNRIVPHPGFGKWMNPNDLKVGRLYWCRPNTPATIRYHDGERIIDNDPHRKFVTTKRVILRGGWYVCVRKVPNSVPQMQNTDPRYWNVLLLTEKGICWTTLYYLYTEEQNE